jgi:hypothetical protein
MWDWTRRFLSATQSWNRYAYVLNSPLMYVDPSGMYHCAPNATPTAGNGLNCGSISDSGMGGLGGVVFLPGDSIVSLGDDGVDTFSVDAGTWGFLGDFGASSSGSSSGFTLGIRAPGQSYKQCLAQNAHTYSAGGALELAANVATGTNTDYSSNRAVDFVTGNSINSVLFGSATDAGLAGAGQAPGLIDAGMGAVTTYGRRTGTSLAALNLAGNGGVPKALSEAGGRLATKSFFSTVGNALNLGLSAATRLGIDIGLTGAELIGCAIPQS